MGSTWCAREGVTACSRSARSGSCVKPQHSESVGRKAVDAGSGPACGLSAMLPWGVGAWSRRKPELGIPCRARACGDGLGGCAVFPRVGLAEGSEGENQARRPGLVFLCAQRVRGGCESASPAWGERAACEENPSWAYVVGPGGVAMGWERARFPDGQGCRGGRMKKTKPEAWFCFLVCPTRVFFWGRVSTNGASCGPGLGTR